MGRDQFLNKLEEINESNDYYDAGMAFYRDYEHDEIEVEEVLSKFADSFIGYFDSSEDFAYQFIAETMDLTPEMEHYFDYNRWLFDFQANGGWYTIIEPADFNKPVRVAVFNG